MDIAAASARDGKNSIGRPVSMLPTSCLREEKTLTMYAVVAVSLAIAIKAGSRRRPPPPHSRVRRVLFFHIFTTLRFSPFVQFKILLRVLAR